MTGVAFGILIGGGGTRMGGVAKGLLRKADGTPLVAHLVAQCRAVAPVADLLLLGARDEYDEVVQLPRLQDSPGGVGPLGGLHALLQEPYEEVVLLACDLPFLGPALLQRLIDEPLSTAVAPTRGVPARWEPLCSRFRVSAALPVVREQLQLRRYGVGALLERLKATPLPLAPPDETQLDDWDTPADIRRTQAPG